MRTPFPADRLALNEGVQLVVSSHGARRSGNYERGAYETDIHIARRLRLARKLAKLSQEQLARRIGVTFQQVQKYETGVTRISASRLWQIALAFGQPMSFFLPPTTGDRPHAGARSRSEIDHLMERMSTPECMELRAAYLRIEDPEIRRRVLALVRSIADEATQALPSL